MIKTGRRPLFYGWILVAVCLLMALLGYGMRYSFSVFYVPFLDEFGWSRGTTAGPYSLNLITYGIAAAVVGLLVNRLGPRKVIPLGSIVLAAGLAALSRTSTLWHLFVFHGLIVAFGVCMVGNVSLIPLISNWFLRRRAMAIGVLFAGVAGAPILAPLVQYLIGLSEWRGAYLILAVMVIAFIGPATVLFIRTRPEDIGLTPDGDVVTERAGEVRYAAKRVVVVNKQWAATEWTLPLAMRTRQFWGLFLVNLCIGFEVNLLLVHQVRHAVDVGFSEMVASSALGLVGFMTMVGCLGGFIADRIGREIACTLGVVGSLFGVVALTLIIDAHQLWMLYFYAIVFGFFYGLKVPAQIASHADIFQGRSFASINGLFLTGFGIGGAVGPYVGGFLFDLMDSYRLAFVLAMVMAGVGCASLWMAAPSKIRRLVARAP